MVIHQAMLRMRPEGHIKRRDLWLDCLPAEPSTLGNIHTIPRLPVLLLDDSTFVTICETKEQHMSHAAHVGPTCQFLLNCMLRLTDVQPQQVVEMTQQGHFWVPCTSKDQCVRSKVHIKLASPGRYKITRICLTFRKTTLDSIMFLNTKLWQAQTCSQVA